jgi:hypothetical protein
MNMDIMKNPKIINANGVCITPELLIKALAWSGLKWRMHMAQVVSLESQSLRHAVETQSTQILNELSPFLGERTLMGIPVQLSEDVPTGTIELLLNEEVIYKMEALAIPSGTPWNYHD